MFCAGINTTVNDVSNMIQTHFQCESQIGILIDCLFEIGDSDYALTKHVYEFLDIIIDTWTPP